MENDSSFDDLAAMIFDDENLDKLQNKEDGFSSGIPQIRFSVVLLCVPRYITCARSREPPYATNTSHSTSMCAKYKYTTLQVHVYDAYVYVTGDDDTELDEIAALIENEQNPPPVESASSVDSPSQPDSTQTTQSGQNVWCLFMYVSSNKYDMVPQLLGLCTLTHIQAQDISVHI